MMDWSPFAAVLFDLDGVITPTADVHRRAWTDMFNGFLAGLDGQQPLTDDDYRTKPNYENPCIIFFLFFSNRYFCSGYHTVFAAFCWRYHGA